MTNREVKSFAFEVKEFGSDDEYFTFEGYASTFGNTDLDGDIIDAGAFDSFISTNKQIPILWSHQMNMPVGKTTQLYIDQKGLYIKARLPKGDDFVKGRVIPQMKVGSISEMSIGFFVKDYDIQKGTRHIKEVDLFETSLVAKAANPQALISGFKAFSGKTNLPFAPKDTKWDSAMAIKHMKILSGSLESPSPSYKNYFMVYDAEKPDDFGSYKLPFVDVIGEKVVIVPQAIYAIAAALQGSRGGIDLSDDDRSKVEAGVNKLYKKMAEEFNDDSIVSPLSKEYDDEDDKKNSSKSFESLKDVEAELKSKGYSQSQAKMMIARIGELKKHDKSNQRDAEEAAQRDVAVAKALYRHLELLKKINNNIN
jgi:HK97 family phage prohead protease